MRDLERLLANAAIWIAPVSVLAALFVGVSAGLGPALLILASGMLLGAVLLLWSSLGRLTGESPLTLEEAVGLGAPSPEEEKKRSVLRALKDLEFEKSVGKISDEDFAELSTRYRTEAKTLLRSLEAELAPRRQKAETKLRARLKKEGIVEKAPARDPAETHASGPPDAPPASSLPSTPPGSRPPDASPASSPRTAAAPRSCESCKTANDGDAQFCKRCGASLGAGESLP